MTLENLCLALLIAQGITNIQRILFPQKEELDVLPVDLNSLSLVKQDAIQFSRQSTSALMEILLSLKTSGLCFREINTHYLDLVMVRQPDLAVSRLCGVNLRKAPPIPEETLLTSYIS